MKQAPQDLVSYNALWLLLPPIALCLLDLTFTFYGQPAEYWDGNYAAVQEGSPSFAYYMSINPLVCLAVDLLWIAIFSLVILLLPETLALIVAVAIMLGHLAGTASWLFYRFNGYQYCDALFLATAVLVVFAFKRGQRGDGRSAIDWERTGFVCASDLVVSYPAVSLGDASEPHRAHRSGLESG